MHIQNLLSWQFLFIDSCRRIYLSDSQSVSQRNQTIKLSIYLLMCRECDGTTSYLLKHQLTIMFSFACCLSAGKKMKQTHAHYSSMNNIRRWNAPINKSKAMERYSHDKTAQWTSSNTIDRTQSILKINNIFLFIYFISFLLSCTISSTYISCTM